MSLLTIHWRAVAGGALLMDLAAASPGRRLEVLQNWLAPAENVALDRYQQDVSRGRYIFRGTR